MGIAKHFNGKAFIDLRNKGLSRRQRSEGGITIQQLSAKLTDQEARRVDILAPYGDVCFVPGLVDSYSNEEGDLVEKFGLFLKLRNPEGETIGAYAVSDRVIQHLVNHCKESQGKATTIGKHYLDVLLDDNADEEDVKLACVNLNHWMLKRSGEKHYSRGKAKVAKGVKRIFVRLLAMKGTEVPQGTPEERLNTEGATFIVTALMSDSYFAIPSAHMVATALQVVTGKYWDENDPSAPDHTGAQGARIWDYYVDPYRVSFQTMNPGMAFDGRDPDAGVIYADSIERGDDGSTYYNYAGRGRDGGNATFKVGLDGGVTNINMASKRQCHLVFPSVRISNDEGGGGSASCSLGIFEVLCLNGWTRERALQEAHRSTVLKDVNESNKTREARTKVIMCELADALAGGFDPATFELHCRNFFDLAETKVKDKKGALEYVADKLSLEGVLGDLIDNYEQFNEGEDTLLDVQRAVTRTAQDQAPEIAERMETFAGELAYGEQTIKKDLLEVA